MICATFMAAEALTFCNEVHRQ